MASKLVILGVFMAALVVLANARTTTIITTEIDVEDGSTGRRMGMDECRRQLSGSQWPNHCEDYMKQIMKRSIIDHDDGRKSFQYFEKCCDDLKEIQPQCQCEAMKMTMMDEGMGMKHQKMMMGKAMMIPMMCGTMKRQCPMSYMKE